MIIINSLEEKDLKRIKKPVCLTLGMFDGFHLGHQSLIDDTIKAAQKLKAHSGIFTFKNHPLSLLAPSYCPPSILTPAEKEDLARIFNIDLFCQIPFTHSIADLSPEDFAIKILKEKLKTIYISIGFNFRFGKDGIGTPAMLKQIGEKNNFSVNIIPPVSLKKGKIISSTSIRELIEAGETEQAAEILTRPHSIKGKVVKGFGRGRQLGFPTANLKINYNTIIPACGIYAVLVKVENNIYQGMMDIGFNPTFNGDKLSLEVNIFDFDKNILGENIRIFFISKMRDEIKFETSDKLKKQLQKDYLLSQKILSKISSEKIELCRLIKI